MGSECGLYNVVTSSVDDEAFGMVRVVWCWYGVMRVTWCWDDVVSV